MNSQTRHFRRLAQQALAPVIIFAIVGYFIYHSVQGERGILALLQLQTHLSKTQNHLAHIHHQRQTLEEKVDRLRPTNIDRDLLDQQVRLILGYAHPDDIVILTLDKSSPIRKE